MTDKPPNHRLSAMACPASAEDVDLFGPGAQEHWYEAYRLLHAQAPVQRVPGEGLGPGSDGYILTRYADIARVVKDPERFKPTIQLAIEGIRPAVEQAYSDGVEPEFPPQITSMIVSMATLRPDHELYRAHKLELTDPWVGSGAARHEGMIRRAADELIDGWIDRGQVEFVAGFARPLPQRVLTNLLGFPPADRPRVEAWGAAMVRAFVHGSGHRALLSDEDFAQQTAELADLAEYLKQQVADKRAGPQDDMISFLTQVTYQALGRKLRNSEIVGIVYAMLLGGLETTQYALEAQAQLLCDAPALFAQLRTDRSRLRPFVEEAMRLRAPTQGLSTRVTTRDEQFQDVAVPKGSLLHLRWGAGNVDPQQYPDPDALDLERKGVAGHLAFSQGPRTCPGAGLSRLEQNVAWNRLLDRLTRLDYAPGNTFLHQPGIMLGTLELHLTFEKAGD